MDDILESELHDACAHLGHNHQVGDKLQYLANKQECLGCLKDLHIHLKQSAATGHRTRLKLGEWKVLPNHLVPLFQAYREDHDIVLAVLQVMVLLTERCEIFGAETEELRLLAFLQDYKEAFLQKDTFIILLGMLVENMDDDEDGQRPERRRVLFDLNLDLLRNLVVVPDPGPGDSGFTPMRRDMQMAYIRHFHDEGVLDFFSLFAEGVASEREPEKKAWALADIIYSICAHTDPEALTRGARGKDKSLLTDLLARDQADSRIRRPMATRHSRFGTAILSRTAEGSETLLTSVMEQHTVSKSSSMWRREFHNPEARNSKKLNMFHDPFFTDLEEGSVRDHNLLNPHVKNSLEAAKTIGEEILAGLRKFFEEFMQTSFSSLVPLLRSSLGNPRHMVQDADRPGGRFDRMKLLNLVAWFLEFHRLHHAAATAAAKKSKEEAPIIDIASIQGAVDLDMIQFVTARLREYGRESNMHASHLVVALRAMSQQVKTIDVVVDSADKDTRDCGEILTQNIIKDNVMFHLGWVLKNYTSSTHDPRIMTYGVEVFHHMLRLMRRLSERKGQKLEFQVEKLGRGSVMRGVTTIEQEIARLADARVVDNLFHLLEKYKRLSAQLASMLVKLIYSIVRAERENIVVFFELSYFIRISRIWADPLVRDKKRGQKYQEMVQLLQYILRQFFKCAEVNQCVFVELLFRKAPESQKEASLVNHAAEFAAILDNYENEEYAQVLEKMRAGETLNELKSRQRKIEKGILEWSDAEDEILRTRFHVYAEHPLCAELLAAELPEDTQRTGTQVRKRLVELGLITSGRQAGMPARAQSKADQREDDDGEPPAKKSKFDEAVDPLLETDLERLLDAAMAGEDGIGFSPAKAGASVSFGAASQGKPGSQGMDLDADFAAQFDTQFDSLFAPHSQPPVGLGAAAAGGAPRELTEAEMEAEMDAAMFAPESQALGNRMAMDELPASFDLEKALASQMDKSTSPSAADGAAREGDVDLKRARASQMAKASQQDGSPGASFNLEKALASQMDKATPVSAAKSAAGESDFDLERALASQMDKDSQLESSPVRACRLETALDAQMDKGAALEPAVGTAGANAVGDTQGSFDLERALESQMDKATPSPAKAGDRTGSVAAGATQGRFNLAKAMESQMDKATFLPATAGAAGESDFDLERAMASQLDKDASLLRAMASPAKVGISQDFVAGDEEDPDIAMQSMLDEDMDLP